MPSLSIIIHAVVIRYREIRLKILYRIQTLHYRICLLDIGGIRLQVSVILALYLRHRALEDVAQTSGR